MKLFPVTVMKNLVISKTIHTCKIHHPAFLLVLVVAILSIGVSPAETAKKPVVKVNSTILTETDLEEALNEIIPAGVFHGAFSSKKRMEYRPQAIEKRIENELFYQEAVEKNLKVDRTFVESRREKTIKRLGGMKQFKAALDRAELSDKQYQVKLGKKSLIAELITTEIVNKAQITDEDIKDYYLNNKEKFRRPEARKIRQILISVEPNATPEEREQRRQRAGELITQIDAGEDMAALAWKMFLQKLRQS